ncbi:putative Cytochrome P450 [Seiridium cardinale]|uniref:Cytochrome P450 n=1 Tax=Seiridium cardinale TaxID=138064 RepID=A0ABR2XKM6_9PEZI
MDQPVGNLSESAVAYKAIAAVVAGLICYQLFFNAASSYKLPVWAPLEIALTTYLVNAGGFGRRIYSTFRRYDGSLFGLSKRHQVLINLPNIDRFMSQGHHTLEHLPTQLALMKRVFGSDDSPEFVACCDAAVKPLLAIVEKEFVTEIPSTAALQRSHIHRNMSSLVTFTSSQEDMQIWERFANTKVIVQPGPDQAGAVEANLMSLMRDFGTAAAIPVLYGKDFLQRNPNLLEDFWRFDNDLFPLLIVGLPTWLPFKFVREGLAARTRLIAAMNGLYRRIDQYQKGEPVDFGADMSDVGVAMDRNKVYAKHNVPIKYRADLDFPFLWGQNGNTQPLLFWYVIYAYSAPGLVDRYREEMAPYVRLSSGKGPVKIESVDISALNRECPLMKSALFEVFRLGSEPTSIRRIAKPITVMDGEYKHQLEPGSYISAPYAVIQNDPAVFSEPEKFVPERFLEVDAETGKKLPRYGRLRPWGIGSGSCKGRTFAEKEILTIAACLMSVWDLEPAHGKWEIPAMMPGTGAKRPVNDIRVILRQRVLK